MAKKGNPELDLSVETKRDAFLTVQFNSLRQEIELQISERRKVEAQTFVGMAVIYAWLFSNFNSIDPDYTRIAFIIPIVFSILGFLRWGGIMMRIMTLSRYNKIVEEKIIGPEGGWEKFLEGVRTDRPLVGRLEGFAEALVWIAAIVGSVTIFWLH